MSYIAFGIPMSTMLIGQGPGATLKVEWKNERGTWERRRVVSASRQQITLDNGQIVVATDAGHRVRPWYSGESITNNVREVDDGPDNRV